MSKRQGPGKGTHGSELPYTEWEKHGPYGCFYPITKKDSTRLLKWLTWIFLFLFLLLLFLTR